MIELQRPPPHSMPHAVASRSSLNSFHPGFCKFEPLLPPLSSLNSSASGNLFGTQQQSIFNYPRPLTPPGGMSAPHGGLDVTQYNGYGSQRGGEMLSGQRRQDHAGNSLAYSNNRTGNYQAGGQYGGQTYGAPASPKTQRQPVQSAEPVSRRKTATGAVAPSLQIPSSIQTPQGSMPQLAAEVCTLRPSARVSLIVPDYMSLLVRKLFHPPASPRPQITPPTCHAPRG